MMQAIFRRGMKSEPAQMRAKWALHWGLVTLAIAALIIILFLSVTYLRAPADVPLVVESTPGQLALWMAEQSGEDAPESILGQYAKQWAAQLGQDSLDETILLNAMRNGLVLYHWIIALVAVAGTVGLFRMASWSRAALMIALVGLDALLFIVPTLPGDTTLALVLVAILLMLFVLLFAPGPVTKTLGFLVVLSALLMAWEAFKTFSASVDYRIGLAQPAWSYKTYPSLDATLAALEAGEISAAVADSKDLGALMPASMIDRVWVGHGRWPVLLVCLYLPALVMVLLRPNESPAAAAG